MLKRAFVAVTLILVATVTVLAAGKNLQHYKKDISEDDLKAEMKVIKRSLGTSCDHCHQKEPARDFSVDTEDKKVARNMLDMCDKLNEKVMTREFMNGGKIQKATCYMCHKGQVKVELAPKDPSSEERFNGMVESGRKKRTIDAMKKLVDELNKNYFTWKDAPKATCWMCHRGRGEFRSRLPRQTEDDDADEAPSGKKDEKKPEEKKPEKKGGDEPF